MHKSNRSGFTLVELIFVIVIIGVLAAVAVPKFAGLKQNAEASSVIKVAKDAYASIPSAYVNEVDLSENTITKISELVEISGNNWDTTTNILVAAYNDGGAANVITLTLSVDDRSITLLMDCDNFKDASTQAKCHLKLGTTADAAALSALTTSTTF